MTYSMPEYWKKHVKLAYREISSRKNEKFSSFFQDSKQYRNITECLHGNEFFLVQLAQQVLFDDFSSSVYVGISQELNTKVNTAERGQCIMKYRNIPLWSILIHSLNNIQISPYNNVYLSSILVNRSQYWTRQGNIYIYT